MPDSSFIEEVDVIGDHHANVLWKLGMISRISRVIFPFGVFRAHTTVSSLGNSIFVVETHQLIHVLYVEDGLI